MNPNAFPIRRFATVALVGAAFLAGCDDNRVTGTALETDDANYIEGQRLAKEGKDEAALECFTKVILSRRSSPEAHLEAGNLCLDTKIKDPLEAIYHFRQYAKQSSTLSSGRRELINGRIRAAEKDFLRGSSLPFASAEGAGGNDALLDQIKRLREENDTLKRRLSEQVVSAARPAIVTARPPEDESAGVVDSGVAPAATASVATNAAPAPTVAPRPPATVAAPAGSRKYTVVQGDTLSKVARKVYGNTKRWPDIQNANTDKLKGSTRLPLGMELVIPN